MIVRISRQAISALPAAFILVAAGCGSGPGPRPEARATASLRARVTPKANAPTKTKAPRKSGPPATAGSPTPVLATAKPIPKEAAAAVSTWLKAIEDEDYVTQRAATFDAALTLVTIREIIAQENLRRGGKTDNTVEISEPPRVTGASLDTARVSLKATNDAVVSGEKGTFPEKTVIEGPVVLKRLEGVWHITDLVYGGTPLQPGYFPVDVRKVEQGFLLVVGVLLSYKATTAAIVRFVNEKGGLVPIKVKTASIFARDGAEQNWTQFAFESRDTPRGFLGFPKVEGKPRSMRVQVEREDTHQTWSYEISF